MGNKALASSMLLLLRNKAGISKLAVAKDWDCELVTAPSAWQMGPLDIISWFRTP